MRRGVAQQPARLPYVCPAVAHIANNVAVGEQTTLNELCAELHRFLRKTPRRRLARTSGLRSCSFGQSKRRTGPRQKRPIFVPAGVTLGEGAMAGAGAVIHS